MKKSIILFFTIMFLTISSFANDSGVEMADELRSSGKIYVVVAVMTLIFTVFIVYLFIIDKRLKKVENQK
jgi:bacteriorhodopsin